MPPTKLPHMGTSFESNPSLPFSSEWGWDQDNEGKWVPFRVISLTPHEDAENWSNVPAKNVVLKDVVVIKPISRVHSSVSLVVYRHVE